MSTASYAIGDLARHTGTKVETIRWYERDGIMPSPARTEGGRRGLHPGASGPASLYPARAGTRLSAR